MLYQLFAHAENTAISETSFIDYIHHWYVAIPLFFITIAAVGYLTWLVSNRNSQVTLGVITFVLLIIGFTSFNLSAAVSIIAILLGLISSLFAAITSIVK